MMVNGDRKITLRNVNFFAVYRRRTRKGMKDKRNRHGAVSKSSLEQYFHKSTAITFIV